MQKNMKARVLQYQVKRMGSSKIIISIMLQISSEIGTMTTLRRIQWQPSRKNRCTKFKLHLYLNVFQVTKFFVLKSIDISIFTFDGSAEEGKQSEIDIPARCAMHASAHLMCQYSFQAQKGKVPVFMDIRSIELHATPIARRLARTIGDRMKWLNPLFGVVSIQYKS